MLAYISGTVEQELLLRNEYLAAENRILRAQINGALIARFANKDGDFATAIPSCSCTVFEPN